MYKMNNMIKKNKLTIKDIAEYAKVSKTTVSFYLNGKFEKMSEETKKNIENVIKQTEYTPDMIARSLTTKKTKLIGVIVSDITSPFSSNLVAGVDSVARKEDYQIIVASGGYDFEYEKKIINNMLDMRVAGFIVQSSVKFIPLTKKIKEKGGEIVLLDSVSKEYKGDWVKTNNIEITKEAIEVLVKKGYNNFIMVAQNPDFLASRLERKISFEKTLKDLKIDYCVEIVDEKFKFDELKKAIDKHIHKNKKNLLFANNGRILKMVYDFCKIMNYDTPNNVGIIGFDKWEWTDYATPKVSTIAQPNFEEGEKAASLLISKIKKDSKDINDKQRTHVFNCEIFWNESTSLDINTNFELT